MPVNKEEAQSSKLGLIGCTWRAASIMMRAAPDRRE
jgi:hypothetical protein